MPIQPQLQTLILFFLFIAISTAATMPGGWQPIKNPNDPHVKTIAKFAILEHNKAATGTDRLVFSKVVGGQTQVVAGTNYKLVIKANKVDGGHEYEAIVWEKPWEKFRKLTSFKLIKA